LAQVYHTFRAAFDVLSGHVPVLPGHYLRRPSARFGCGELCCGPAGPKAAPGWPGCGDTLGG